jgi:hypothetical protein
VPDGQDCVWWRLRRHPCASGWWRPSPDGQALKKIACEQVASTIDLQSAGQLDALRKALGVAADVDPIGACRALGVSMEPKPQGERVN